MPVVSVVTVFHQRSPHLAAAIGSIRAQTLPDWELILVDNGTGLGRAVLTNDAAGDTRIRIVSRPTNEGIARGIVGGVEAATGKYVALLDYDDVALPRRLERQVTLLNSDPALGLVNCGVDTIDAGGRVTGREFCLIDGDAQKSFSAYATSVVSPAYTGRREVFGQFPHRAAFRWASDFDFFTRVVEQWKVGGVREILQQYRRYPEQTTVTHRAAIILDQCAVRLLAARRRAGQPENLDSIAQEMTSMSALSPGKIYLRFARQCLAEGLSIQAVYHARKALAETRTPPAIHVAGKIFLGAWKREPGRRGLLTRLFFSGSLRAHGLVDDGPGLS